MLLKLIQLLGQQGEVGGWKEDLGLRVQPMSSHQWISGGCSICPGMCTSCGGR